jgi:hypothetical protein
VAPTGSFAASLQIPRRGDAQRVVGPRLMVRRRGAQTRPMHRGEACLRPSETIAARGLELPTAIEQVSQRGAPGSS